MIATARQLASLAELRAAGMQTQQLDVTQTDAIQSLAATLKREQVAIDILVNNAGYGLFGPLMDLTPDEISHQLATNVVAPVAMVQAIAPLMKSQGSGLILNIASVSSIFVTPFAGAYCGSKAALRMMSDALRMELAPFGIRVVTVHPGAIASGFGHNAKLPQSTLAAQNSWYVAIADKVQMRATLSQQNATPTQGFARELVKAVDRSILPPELWLGNKSSQLPWLKRWLPTPILDRLLKQRFGLVQLKSEST